MVASTTIRVSRASKTKKCKQQPSESSEDSEDAEDAEEQEEHGTTGRRDDQINEDASHNAHVSVADILRHVPVLQNEMDASQFG